MICLPKWFHFTHAPEALFGSAKNMQVCGE